MDTEGETECGDELPDAATDGIEPPEGALETAGAEPEPETAPEEAAVVPEVAAVVAAVVPATELLRSN